MAPQTRKMRNASSSSSSPMYSSLSDDSTTLDTSLPLVKFQARNAGPHCPFGTSGGSSSNNNMTADESSSNNSAATATIIAFDLYAGGCVWLKGASGRGKTTLAMYLANLLSNKVLDTLQIAVDTCEWHDELAISERCGVLFQSTTLLDELTVAGNLAVALQQHDDDTIITYDDNNNKQDRLRRRIKHLLETVGLDYDRDAGKRVTELSGGMGRRASLALQLAQRKHVIVLDEPFAGLDHYTAVSIAKELVHLRQLGTALILIAHEPVLAEHVLAAPAELKDDDDDNDEDNGTTMSLREWNERNIIVEFPDPPTQDESAVNNKQPNLFGTKWHERFLERLADYIGYSLPLILLTFTACGMAIAMLSCDTLLRIDVASQVLAIVDKEVRPMIKLLTGEEANAFQLLGIRIKVQGMLDSTLPPAKATLYAMGMAQLFGLEIGPLLTALLLSGRIGGSYAGKVSSMEATQQNQLLRVLGIRPVAWSLGPAAVAALIAGPVLTVTGTFVALALGGYVAGPGYYGIVSSTDEYWKQVRSTLWPEWRLTGWGVPSFLVDDVNAAGASVVADSSSVFLRTTFSTAPHDTVIEIVTYPPVYHIFKALTFMTIIMGTSELCARYYKHSANGSLTPRHVPSVITTAVVTAGLLVILADWWFSQLWLKRH